MDNQTRTVAVVLAGAVAKGAFEAGVIRALVRADVDIVRIVATSSGALNGTLLAAAVRTGDLVGGAERLAALWQDHAEWNEVFHTSFRNILKLEGLSDQSRLLRLLREHVRPSQPAQPRPVQLRMVVAALGGCAGTIGTQPATTFESVRDFHSDDLGTPHGLEGVFTAAVASSAFPLVFAPVAVDGVGPCIDGGAINNTPLKWALDGAIGARLDAVVVIATSAAQRTEPPGGAIGLGSLGSHLAEMLVDERLYRDLREAEQVNAALDGLDRLVGTGVIDAAQLRSVHHALGWSGRRRVEIIPIRPAQELPGNAFSAFLHRDDRTRYLELGYQRGLEVLGGLGWSHRPGPAASVQRDDVVGTAGDGPGNRDYPA
jgi:NTE family protein